MAEDAALDGPYSLVVAAESLHWMDWSVVLPKVAAELVPGAYLALGACRELAPSKQESTTYEPSPVCKLLILDCRLLIPDRLLVERGEEGLAWSAELGQLISMYSTNKEFRSYNLVHELKIRGLFQEVGRRPTAPVPFDQSIDDHIELMHSRNGFSRDRMTVESAADFDVRYGELLQEYCTDETVRISTTVTIVWGIPGTA